MQTYTTFPSTRYLGSKRKLLPVLEKVFSALPFETAADPFCGSGATSYLLHSMGKIVTASDALGCNVICTRALLSPPIHSLDAVLDSIIGDIPIASSPAGFIETHFDNLFFLPHENRFIDQFVSKIASLPRNQKDALLFGLFQASLAKRPYNLFHRANLYMRTKDVKRSFGNKATWDTSFDKLIRRYLGELAHSQIDGMKSAKVKKQRVEQTDLSKFDLVYLDPPYVSKKGMGVDYLDYYHLIEGISLENNRLWQQQILSKYKHKPLAGRGKNPWCNSATILDSFDAVIKNCGAAMVVISYRNDGIPSIAQLQELLKRNGKQVEVVDCGAYVYALSKNKKSREVVIVGR